MPGFGYKKELDLIQNMRQMTKLAGELEDKFAEVEPSMKTIFALRDDFENLEQRTIQIVNNYETNIKNSEAQANKIIDDLNEQVDKIESHIDELLKLSDDFDSISEEIKTIAGMKDTIDKLVKDMENLKSSRYVIIPKGDDIPVDEREEGIMYFKVTDTLVAGLKEGTTIYVTPDLAMKVE